jgi:phage/plasmid-like protein (TIGR03299 family)
MHEVEQMLYVGEKPWHGLGTMLENSPSVEEAIRLGGLDWKVMLQPLHAVVEGQDIRTDHRATIRSTDLKVLGVVGPGYHAVQNSDAFSFFQPVVDSGKVSIETAGSLREGRRVWMLAKINGCDADVVSGDQVKGYFLLANSHDGTITLRLGFTGQRVVCANTMAMALAKGGGRMLRIRHTKGAEEAIQELHTIIDWSQQEFVASVEKMRALANKGVTEATLREYVRKVFKKTVEDKTVAEEEEETKFERLEAKIIPLFEKGRGNDLPGVKGTMWAAYNAVSEYLTWERGRSASNRLDSLWFGEGNKVNAKAFELALAA